MRSILALSIGDMGAPPGAGAGAVVGMTGGAATGLPAGGPNKASLTLWPM